MSTLQHTNVSVWLDTKAKLDRIAKHRRRSIVVTLDEMANEFAARNGIDISGIDPAPPAPSSAQDDNQSALHKSVGQPITNPSSLKASRQRKPAPTGSAE